MEALDVVVEKHWTSHQVKRMVIPETAVEPAAASEPTCLT